MKDVSSFLRVLVGIFSLLKKYKNINEILGVFLYESCMFLYMKIVCYFDIRKDYYCYGFIINYFFYREKWNGLVFYWFGVFLINIIYMVVWR